jgi:acetyl esterase/lipase
MRTGLFARVLAAVTVLGVASLTMTVTRSRTGRLPLQVRVPSIAVSTRVSTPALADPLRPEPVGTFAGVRYGPLAPELLDLYLPHRPAGSGRVPVIVYLHSGGWIGGSRADVDPVAAAQVGRGLAVASVDYQLALPGGGGAFPGAVYDVKRAIRFLKANAGAWGLDPTRVIVMGDSAGGYLAAFVAATRGEFEPAVSGPLAAVDSSVAGAVDVIGPTDFATFATNAHPLAAPLTARFLGCRLIGGRAACPAAALAAASVAPYVDASDPPILLAYGGADTLVVASTQGRPLADAWSRAHDIDPGAVTYLEVPGAGHRYLSPAELSATLNAFLDRVCAS